MKEDLKSIIQQHLPALAAGEMKAFIEQAEKDRQELEQFKTSHKTLTEQIYKANSENTALKLAEDNVKKLDLDLREKEKALNLKEFNLKLEELKYQLEAEKNSKNSIFQLVQTFVANPRAIEVTTRNRSYCTATDYSPTGNSHYPVSSIETETKEIKEEK